MIVTRTIHPVGQGAFYTESFTLDDGKQFNIVYDCGTISTRTSINNAIKRYPHQYIDILFISHFHEDHINKILDLLQGRSVRRIIMPFIDSEEKIISFANLGVKYFDLIYNPQQFFGCDNITYVKGDDDIEGDIYEVSADGINLPPCIRNGSKIKFSQGWYFKVANIKTDINKKTDFFNAIKSVNRQDTIDICAKIKVIKKAFVDVFTDGLNNTSLVLYSGSMSCRNFSIKYKCLYSCFWTSRIYSRCACLYLGDIEIASRTNKKLVSNATVINELKIIFAQELNSLLSIQVPHHCAYTSNSKDFWDVFRAPILFMCFGSANLYNHPNAGTLSLLSGYHTQLKIITDNPKTIFQYTFNL